MKTILSSYNGRRGDTPKARAEFRLAFLNNGNIIVWTQGSGVDGRTCWVRAVRDADRKSVVPTPSLAVHFYNADRLWVDCGLEPYETPPGECVGYDDDIKLPTSDGFYQNGWLSQDGKWFPCGHYGHDGMAELLYYGKPSPISKMEIDGWCRVSAEEPVLGPTGNPMGSLLPLSNEQAEWLLKHT